MAQNFPRPALGGKQPPQGWGLPLQSTGLSWRTDLVGMRGMPGWRTASKLCRGVMGWSLSSLEGMGAVRGLGAPGGMASPEAARPLRGAQAAMEPPALGLCPVVPRR